MGRELFVDRISLVQGQRESSLTSLSDLAEAQTTWLRITGVSRRPLQGLGRGGRRGKGWGKERGRKGEGGGKEGSAARGLLGWAKFNLRWVWVLCNVPQGLVWLSTASYQR